MSLHVTENDEFAQSSNLMLTIGQQLLLSGVVAVWKF